MKQNLFFNLGKNEQTMSELWDNFKQPNMHVTEALGEKEQKMYLKK